MTTAQREFEQTAASLGASFDRRGAGRLTEGARLRLLLAVAGLAALVAWGALSHVGIEASTDARGATSAQEAPRYDGSGKWTGYTSEWRSRPQILRDAGITQGR
jgi:hypothetical protein